ncbi:cardiolipin synthase [bacterium]|nr:cardiolipin synthase [bacterium]
MDWLLIAVTTYQIYILVAIVFIIVDNREPSSTLAWILVFVFLPILGFVFYFFIGRKWHKRKKSEQVTQHILGDKLFKTFESLVHVQEKQMEMYDRIWRQPAYKKELMHLLYHSSQSLLTTENDVRLYHDGEDKFRELLIDLQKAKKTIHMEYFIWRSDDMTAAFHECLIAKAAEGVVVRVLYDFFGSWTLKNKDIRKLRRAGIAIYPYYNFLSFMKLHTLNYRNHRKIVVIDGTVGYTGGMNMGQEYRDGGEKFPFWRDTHLRMEGQAVMHLQGIFAIDWYNTTHESLFEKSFFRFPAKRKKSVVLPVQITTSGPDSEWPSIEQLYFCMINSAQKYVYIQSSYFIPSPSIYTALKTAVLRGLDVRITIAGLPDKKIPYWTAFTYFKELLEAGMKIYHYKKGFMHAKTIVIDRVMCSVGTANMDLRSFRLNYELSSVFYDSRVAGEVEKQFVQDMKDSREFTLEDYLRLGQLKNIRNSLARLFAPLL